MRGVGLLGGGAACGWEIMGERQEEREEGKGRLLSPFLAALLAEGVEKYLERHVPPRLNDGWAIRPGSDHGPTCQLLLAI